MKTKNIKGKLSLSKNVISNLKGNTIKGGTYNTYGCLSGGSWCCTLAGCPPISDGCTEESACCPPIK